MQNEHNPSHADQIIWAAGVFEGEGCFSNGPARDGRTGSPRAALKMCDRDVVDRFVAIVGIGSVTVREPGKAHWKTQFNWQVGGIQQVGLIVDLFWPWLGERRRQLAVEVLERGAKGRIWSPEFCPNGHPINVRNMAVYQDGDYKKRHCRVCARERFREKAEINPSRFKIPTVQRAWTTGPT